MTRPEPPRVYAGEGESGSALGSERKGVILSWPEARFPGLADSFHLCSSWEKSHAAWMVRT